MPAYRGDNYRPAQLRGDTRRRNDTQEDRPLGSGHLYAKNNLISSHGPAGHADRESPYDSRPQNYGSNPQRTTHYGRTTPREIAFARTTGRQARAENNHGRDTPYGNDARGQGQSQDKLCFVTNNREVRLEWYCKPDPKEQEVIETTATSEALKRGSKTVAVRSNIHNTTRIYTTAQRGPDAPREVVACDWHYTVDFMREDGTWDPAHVYTNTEWVKKDKYSRPVRVTTGLAQHVAENPEVFRNSRYGHHKGEVQRVITRTG